MTTTHKSDTSGVISRSNYI